MLLRSALLLLCCSPLSAQVLHRYGFDAASGVVVLDDVGGAHGTAYGGAVQGGLGYLELDGVDDYVELPAGLVSSHQDVTIEAWVTVNGSSVPSWARVFDFNETSAGAGQQGNGLNYLFLSASSNQGVPATGIKLSTPSSIKVFAANPAPTNVELHFVMVYSGSTDELHFYIDGVSQGSVAVTDELTQFSDVNCWLGQSFTGNDPRLPGRFNEFRIHAGAFSAAEVLQSFIAGPDSLGGLGTEYCTPAVPNSTGQPGHLGALGSDLAADNSVLLRASGLPPGQFGVFLTSQAQGFVAGPGGSMGNLCLSNLGFYLAPGQVQLTSSIGVMSLPLDLTQTPTAAGLTSIQAGQTWHFQAWHRDWLQAPTTNFTNALTLPFQ